MITLSHLRLGLLAGLILGLSACDLIPALQTDQPAPPTSPADRVPDGSEVLLNTPLVQGAPAGGLTVADFAAVKQPLSLVTVVSSQALVTMTRAATNGGVEVWRSPDDVTLNLRKGVIVGTRGLGADLMTADVDQTVAALTGAAEISHRIHRRLDGQFKLQPSVFICDITQNGRDTIQSLGRNLRLRKVTETCTGVEYRFTNVYFIGADGRIWVSQQWVSPEIGHLRIDRIHW